MSERYSKFQAQKIQVHAKPDDAFTVHIDEASHLTFVVQMQGDASLHKKLDQILGLLDNIVKKEEKIMADLTNLEAQVKATTDAEDSAILLIQGIAAALADAKTDPAAIQALADQLQAGAANLAAAVVANTPSEPAPPAPTGP